MAFEKNTEDNGLVKVDKLHNKRSVSQMKNLENKTITAISGKKYRLGKVLGSGAQGIVFEEASGKCVVKLYYPNANKSFDQELKDQLKFVKDVKKPRNFVHMYDLFDSPYIGYAMEKVSQHKALNSYLIPDVKKSFSDWYNEGRGFRCRLVLGYIIAKAFCELSSDNLSYCDISGNNILVKIDQGQASVRMIDIDNMYVAGDSKANVLGTPRYIAPEIINKEKLPDVFSDNYSLAVILFELLRVGHPYVSDAVVEGSPEDEESAYAGKTDYVTDENSNNMLPSNIVFTDKLSELFERCFVNGKNNRMNRPSAKEFEYAMLEASNKIIECSHCNAWHYPRKENGKYLCPWCSNESTPKAYLNFYDKLYIDDGTIIIQEPETLSEKLINSYILREQGKNPIKNYYILRAETERSDFHKTKGNYITIVKNGNKYFAYNEFDKQGIYIKSFKTKKYTKLVEKNDIELESGDEVYFGVEDGKAVKIECGGKIYKYIRMARFVEVKR